VSQAGSNRRPLACHAKRFSSGYAQTFCKQGFKIVRASFLTAGAILASALPVNDFSGIFSIAYIFERFAYTLFNLLRLNQVYSHDQVQVNYPGRYLATLQGHTNLHTDT